jgi:hypothetical protein
VERAFARDCDGAEKWIVAVRATFDFDVNGYVSVAKTQQDVCLAPIHFGDPSVSSMKYDTDLVRAKSGTDIIVHASAHAPGGRPAPHVDVGWSVGTLTKRLRIYGDRVWEKRKTGIAPSEPVPFVSLPIRYERAWGGTSSDDGVTDPANPVGIGRDATPGKPVPNCTFPDDPILLPGRDRLPAGFGPIAYHWQPRVGLAGTYDQVWRRTRYPLLPIDFQDGYLRCAPIDQQVNHFLSGGEDVILNNISQDGYVRFLLPRIHLGFSTQLGRKTVHHRGVLHTIVLEPEERRLLMIWNAVLSCHHTLYDLKQTIVVEKTRLPLGARLQ